MKFAIRLWSTLKKPENIITLVGILVGAVLAIIDITDPSRELMLAAVVFILAGLSISQLVASYEVTKRWEQLDRVEHLHFETVEGIRTLTNSFFRDRTIITREIRERLASANEILIAGRTLSIVSQQMEFLQSRIDNGCSLQLVILNPKATYPGSAEHPDPSVLYASLKRLQKLQSHKSNGGEVEIRMIDTMLNVGIIAADLSTAEGQIFVEMALFGCDSFARPSFSMRRNANPKWYDLFEKSCKSIIAESKQHVNKSELQEA